MWLISFHGGSQGINNLLTYQDDGTPRGQAGLLPTGEGAPPLRELRGFEVVDPWLYVVNSYQQYSQILVYEANAGGGYDFRRVLAARAGVPGIIHPYDLTFDHGGNCYVSCQDSNVVIGLQSAGSPLAVAPALKEKFPPPGAFLDGTQVASSLGSLPAVPAPAPPAVPAPLGLQSSYTDANGARVLNSVRGVQHHKDCLYVADEPGNSVKVYNLATGVLLGEIAGSNLLAPVQLLLQPATHFLYIGSKGNDSVVRHDLSGGPPTGTVAPETFIDGKIKHISALALDAAGQLYAAERKAQRILRFPADGSGKGMTFIDGLPDEPEFMGYRSGD